jgi:hypothetical protein
MLHTQLHRRYERRQQRLPLLVTNDLKLTLLLAADSATCAIATMTRVVKSNHMTILTTI